MTDLQEVTQRLERAERRTSTAQGMAALALAAALGIGLLQAGVAKGKGTTAKAPFRVVDERGNKLVEITTSPLGEGGYVYVYNKDAKPVIHLMGDPQGGAIALTNPDRHALVDMAAFESWGDLHIDNTNGAAGVNLSTQNGHPTVDLYGASSAFDREVTNTGGHIALHDDEAGYTVAELGVDAAGGRLTLSDHTAKALFTAP